MSWNSRIPNSLRRPVAPASTQGTPARPAARSSGNQAPRPVDSFASAPRTSALNLTGQSAPVVFTEGNTQVSTTQTAPDGSTVTNTAGTGNGNVTLSQTSTGSPGTSTTNTVSVGPSGTTVGSSTTSNGVGTSGSISLSGDGITASAGNSVTVKGAKISFGTQVSSTSNVESQGGVTTLTVDGSTSVNLGGDVNLGTGGFGAQYTEGVRTRFQVRMPDAHYALVESGAAPMPTPYEPATMPVGSSVMLNETDFESTGFRASYQRLRLDTKVTEEQGVSVLVERPSENIVRVTAGPTQAVENSFKFGVSLGPASAYAGNTTRLDQYTLQTVDFDVSTQEGLAAYNHFLATGELPTQNGPGISGVATVETTRYDSTSTAGASIGPLSASVDFANSNMTSVRTTYPDGSYDVVTDAQLHEGTPVHIEQHFNADGTEDLSRQSISMFMVGMDGGAEDFYAGAFGVEPSSFDKDNDVHLSFTAQQSMDLSQRARDHIARWEQETGLKWDEVSHTPDEMLITELARAENPTQVANALTGAYGGPEWMGQAFMSMSIVDGQHVPLPGTIEARDRNGGAPAS